MSKKRKSNRYVLAFFADIHCGSKFALCPPGIELYEIDMEGQQRAWTPSLTPAQEELWSLYQGNVEQVMDFADGDNVVVVVVGDVTQGNHFRGEMMVSDTANQVLVANGVISEWFRYPNVSHLRMATGTDVHEFGESSATRLLAEYLKAKYPKKDVSWSHHGLLDVAGVKIDYAHHGPSSGKRKWLEMNNANWYVRDIMVRELLDGRTPPNLVIRADKHTFGIGGLTVVIGSRPVSTDLIVIPSYQALTAFARKVTQSAFKVHHGMVAAEVVDGEVVRVKPFVKEYDLRQREFLK